MKKLLYKIVEECVDYGISINLEGGKNGSVVYSVKGFSKSGKANLYIEDDAIVCETRYGNKEHVFSFRDLVNIANYWYLSYKDKEPFKDVEPEWKSAFERYVGSNYQTAVYDYVEDLPF